jgi:hypothetical protein
MFQSDVEDSPVVPKLPLMLFCMYNTIRGTIGSIDTDDLKKNQALVKQWEEANECCNFGQTRRSDVDHNAMDPTGVRHRLHGDDRQSAVQLDAVRPADKGCT